MASVRRAHRVHPCYTPRGGLRASPFFLANRWRPTPLQTTSGILVSVSVSRILTLLLFFGVAASGAQNPPAPPPQQAAPAASTAPAAPQSPAISVPSLGTVVIDPGHGGTDAGARGSGGILEKDVVMSLAQLLRSALEHQGFRVVITRQADDNPSFDDRAGTANAYRGALVVALHVSSTGTPGVARAYSSAPPPAAAPAELAPRPESKSEKQEPPAQRPVGLTRWEEAQRPYVAASKRLADAVQAQIKQGLDKSPADAAQANLRDLRSISGPAIAVELSSVSIKERKMIDPFLPPLAEAIAQGVRAYRGASAAARDNR